MTLVIFICGWSAKRSNEVLFDRQRELQPSDMSNNFDFQEAYGIYGDKIIPIPKELAYLPEPVVLGANTNGRKRIQVDLTTQHLYAFDGKNLIYDFLISSGKWGKTPQGVFEIWGKFRYTKMEGGSKDLHTYYYLPNVPYVMFFANDQVAPGMGFSLHGTYWHNNFGQPMSHGCVNMKTEEAGLIYEWSEPILLKRGTSVIIYGGWEGET